MRKPRHARPKTILFLGISGSGKGTQATRLARLLRPSYYFEVGVRIRALIGKETIGGGVVRATTTRGELIPTWALLAILGRELIERVPPGVHLIADGTPRRFAEAEFWDEMMADAGRPLPVVIYLTLSKREAQRRLLSRGRAVDDTPAAIARRFAYFRRDVLPVVDYFRRRGRLITVNGGQPVPAVWREIKRKLRL